MRANAALVLLLLIVAPLAAQSPPLNPTVTVLPQATAPVPPGCESSEIPPQIAQPVPTPMPRPVPVPVPVPAPQPVDIPVAAADLRSVLREAHEAALSRDRAAFDAALARAKAMSGATAAERDVIAALSDVQKLWDYQFATPAGSFFDAGAEGGALLSTLRRYPGYDRSIEPHTLNVSGVRYYPVRESILFLLDVARDRLQRAGVRVDRVTEVTPTPSRPQPQPAVSKPPVPKPRPPAKAATSEPTRPRSTTKRATTTRRAPAPRPQPTPPPQPTPRPVTEEPTLPIPSGVVSTAPAPVDLLPPTTTAPTATTATETTATAVVPLDTIEPLQPDTTTATEEAEPPRRGRSIIMPIVLILIGVGVLIVLFRASS